MPRLLLTQSDTALVSAHSIFFDAHRSIESLVAAT